MRLVAQRLILRWRHGVAGRPAGRPAGAKESFAIDLGKQGQLQLVRESSTEFVLARRYRPTPTQHFTRTERAPLTCDTLLAAFRAADTIIDKRFRGV